MVVQFAPAHACSGFPLQILPTRSAARHWSANQVSRASLRSQKRCNTYAGENPVDPPISNSQRDKSEDERRGRHTERDHDSPDAHIPCSLMLKKGLSDNSTANSGRRADEERRDRATEAHGAVRRAFGAANVTD